MQFDAEGSDNTTRRKAYHNENEVGRKLSDHFLENGLSQSAYDKIAPDIENGDMNVNILMDCNDNELNAMASEYNFTFLQQKAFINAVNLIKLSNDKNTNNTTNQNKSNEHHFVDVDVSQEEQSVLNEINGLGSILTKHTRKCAEIKESNSNKIKLAILKLENYRTVLMECIDQEINKLVQQVCVLCLLNHLYLQNAVL